MRINSSYYHFHSYNIILTILYIIGEERSFMDNFLDAFLESINDDIDSLYIEKQTREEYAKRRFKKKYDYNPKEKTITIDGEKYKVDANLDKGQKGKTTKASTELIEYKDKSGIIPRKKYKVVEAEGKVPRKRDTS